MVVRISYLFLILVAVLWLPWWLSVIFGFVGIVRYHHFYEVIIPTLLFDFLYAAPGVTPLGFPLMFSFLAIAMVYLMEDLKTLLR